MSIALSKSIVYKSVFVSWVYNYDANISIMVASVDKMFFLPIVFFGHLADYELYTGFDSNCFLDFDPILIRLDPISA